MPIDDEDPKVRRNLVAFCALLLLFAWLQIPVSAITAKYFDKTPIDPLRLWLAAAVTLAYLYLRYHFTGGGGKAISLLQRLRAEALDRLVSELVHRKYNDATSVQLRPDLDAILDDARVKARIQHADTDLNPRLLKVHAWRPDKEDKCEGEIELVFIWTTKGQSSFTTVSTAIQYALRSRTRLWTQLRAFWTSWVFSEGSLLHLAPILMSAGAAGLIAYRLWQILVP